MIPCVFRLTREVRFAINAAGAVESSERSRNGHAGMPALGGLGYFFALDVSLVGNVSPATSYVCNIKHVDRQVREKVVPLIASSTAENRFTGNGALIARESFDALRDAWTGLSLESIRLALSPYLSLAVLASESPMVRLSQTFEFSASHRLHNPTLSDEANLAAFGKCNNVHGHGHNYVLQVTLIGTPDANGLLIDVPTFEKIVNEQVIDRFDHKHLNVELPQFRELNPSVENIARVIYGMLKPALGLKHSKLASVTVWETPKTSCEYSE